jgi:hypothetical protein
MISVFFRGEYRNFIEPLHDLTVALQSRYFLVIAVAMCSGAAASQKASLESVFYP